MALPSSMVSSPARALASCTAARSEQRPLASRQTPLPGSTSTESVVVSTTKVTSRGTAGISASSAAASVVDVVELEVVELEVVELEVVELGAVEVVELGAAEVVELEVGNSSATVVEVGVSTAVSSVEPIVVDVLEAVGSGSTSWACVVTGRATIEATTTAVAATRARVRFCMDGSGFGRGQTGAHDRPAASVTHFTRLLQDSSSLTVGLRPPSVAQTRARGACPRPPRGVRQPSPRRHLHRRQHQLDARHRGRRPRRAARRRGRRHRSSPCTSSPLEGAAGLRVAPGTDRGPTRLVEGSHEGQDPRPPLEVEGRISGAAADRREGSRCRSASAGRPPSRRTTAR